MFELICSECGNRDTILSLGAGYILFEKEVFEVSYGGCSGYPCMDMICKKCDNKLEEE